MLRFKDLLLVMIQVSLLISYFLNVDWFTIEVFEHFLWFYVGLIGLLILGIALLQLNIHLSPFPPPKPGSKLITNGVFKYIRHPMYAGMLIFMFSFSLWLGDGYKFCISLATLLFFMYKSIYEERLLSRNFENYEAYKAKSGRFLPKF